MLGTVLSRAPFFAYWIWKKCVAHWKDKDYNTDIWDRILETLIKCRSKVLARSEPVERKQNEQTSLY